MTGMLGSRFERACVALLTVLLSACAATNPPPLSEGHLQPPQELGVDEIPAPVARTPFVPPPTPRPKQERFTVVVNDVPVSELLFALARDAKLNVDIHPGITGNVTINAVNQTLVQILNRLAEQVPLVYEFDEENLFISPDKPYFRSYKIDYVNLTRASSSNVSVATQIATTGGSVASGGSGDSGNSSITSITGNSENDFWTTLVENVQAILSAGQTGADATDGAADGTGSARVIANPISGVLTIYGSQREQKEVQAFLDQVMTNASRQVLIEATIVEVELGDRFQSGIDWSWLSDATDRTRSATSSMTGSALGSSPVFVLDLVRQSGDKTMTASVKMLETFGNAKVLSSPKIIALNNQTAILKVVDEKVFFDVDVEVTDATDTAPRSETYTSDILTVPVGVIMSVTPQINENGNISLNVRPTITRITGYVADPALRAQNSRIDNLVPEIQVREMESLLQVRSGQTVVLGGLMENKIDKKSDGVPFLSNLPVVGNLFSIRDDQFTKTELVIFLRPVIAGETGGAERLRGYRELLEPAEEERRNALVSSSHSG